MPGDKKPVRRSKPTVPTRPATRKRKGSKATRSKKPSDPVAKPCPKTALVKVDGLEGAIAFPPGLREKAIAQVMEELQSPVAVAKEFKVKAETVRSWIRSKITADVALGIVDDAEVRLCRVRMRNGVDRLMAHFMPIADGTKDDMQIRSEGEKLVITGTEAKEAAQLVIKLLDLSGRMEGAIRPSPQAVTQINALQVNQYGTQAMSDDDILQQSGKALPALFAAMKRVEVAA